MVAVKLLCRLLETTANDGKAEVSGKTRDK
jgi:hypothetical protein